MTESNYDRFTKTSYSGRELLKKHSLDEEGVWKIEGEDPNCDMGGSHICPYLETVTGKLDEVIRHAVELPYFWCWGGGGNITKINIKSINPATMLKHKQLLQRKQKLEAELKSIEKELE